MRNQGVMILCRDPITNLQPLLPDLWTVNTIATIAHVRLNSRVHLPMALIAHYSQPGRKNDLDDELDFILEQVRTTHPAIRIIIGGDFNRKPDDMWSLSDRLGIQLAQYPGDVHLTHINQKNPDNSHQLDYILTNLPWEDTAIDLNNLGSDHFPLITNIRWDGLENIGSTTKYKKVTKLKKNIAAGEVESVLTHLEWPKRPFILIAKDLNLTQDIFIPRYEAQQFHALVSNAVVDTITQVTNCSALKNDLFYRFLKLKPNFAVDLLHKE